MFMGNFGRMLEGGPAAVEADEEVVGTSRVRELERRARELERLLGCKTMEVEILKESLDVARVKNRYCCCRRCAKWSPFADGSATAAACPAQARRASL